MKLLNILTICFLQYQLSNGVEYIQEMRNFVVEIADYARKFNPSFIIIPQNGIPIVTKYGDLSDPIEKQFLSKISGWGQEDLFYGADSDNVATNPSVSADLVKYLNIAKSNNITILVTDYCSDQKKMNDSYTKNAAKGFLSFAADKRDLNNIPKYPANPVKQNSNAIKSLKDAKNFLYLINPSSYSTNDKLVAALQKTTYDAFIIDWANLTKIQVDKLKVKPSGERRLVISYMSIGEAENYRYYWNKSWKYGNPSFLCKMNPNWQGNFKVKYWYPEWKKIIYGDNTSYTKKLIDSGFDGAYLDIIDAYEYFESGQC